MWIERFVLSVKNDSPRSDMCTTHSVLFYGFANV